MSSLRRVTWSARAWALWAGLLFCSLSYGEDSGLGLLGPSGSLRGSYWSRDKSFSGNHGYAVGSVWLDLKPQEVSGFKFFLDSYVLDQDVSRSGHVDGVLREAYVDKSFGSLDLRVGRQIVVWGRADKLNPTDSFSVKDLNRLLTDDEDQRLGVFATQAVFNFSGFRVIGIWAPEWISPVYPIPPKTGVVFVDQHPDQPSHQFGIKLDESGGIVDGSISYFNGYSKVPNLSLVSSTSQGSRVVLTYDHIQAFGSDFAFNLGSYGLRGELAYTSTPSESGSNPLEQSSFFSGVLGVDHAIVENFNLNVQFLYRHIYDFKSPDSTAGLALLPLARAQAISTQQHRTDQYGASIRPNYKILNDTLEIEAAIATWALDGDYVLRPKVTYSLNDRVRLMVGGEIYGGPEDRFFGQLQQTSSVFTELRFLF